MSRPTTRLHCDWVPSLVEEWIMNFNSSEIREMRRAGYGGVIRINGKQIAGCFGSLEVANSNES